MGRDLGGGGGGVLISSHTPDFLVPFKVTFWLTTSGELQNYRALVTQEHLVMC